MCAEQIQNAVRWLRIRLHHSGNAIVPGDSLHVLRLRLDSQRSLPGKRFGMPDRRRVLIEHQRRAGDCVRQ